MENETEKDQDKDLPRALKELIGVSVSSFGLACVYLVVIVFKFPAAFVGWINKQFESDS